MALHGGNGPGALHTPPAWFLPGAIRIRGGLSATVFQRLAFSPGNPAGSHPGGPAGNSDSISEAYGISPLAEVDSDGKPGNPPSGCH